MKTLTLLRHAKSGWDDPAMRDFDRRLTPRGREAARAVGRHLRDTGQSFDQVIASPAARVSETLAEAAGGYGGSLTAIEDLRLYLAPTTILLEVIHALPSSASSTLLVGHNPGLEELVQLLVMPDKTEPDTAMEENFPTAALARITFADREWSTIVPASGVLASFVCPADLDPALGPGR